MTAETAGRLPSSKPSFVVLDPFASSSSSTSRYIRPTDVDPLESSSPTAFTFPIHSSAAARHHSEHPVSTLTSAGGQHPSGNSLPPNNQRRKSSASRKPTPALSPSLEDLALKETKSRSSTSSRASRTTPEATFLILPDAPLPQPTYTSQHSSRRQSTDAQQPTRTSTSSRTSTVSKSSSARTVNTTPKARPSAQFTPPSRPPPQQPLPPTPPSDSSKPRLSKMNSGSRPTSTNAPSLGAPVQPSVQALRSRYVRPASPGTVAAANRSSSPVSLTGPLTPPAETEKHHGFFSSLRKKKSTLSRPGSASSTKDQFGSPSGRVAQVAASSPGLSASPSTSSFHKQHVRASSSGSMASPEPEAAAAATAAFDDYELTDLTPTTSAPPQASASYFVAKNRAGPPPTSGIRAAAISEARESADRRPSTTSQCSSVGGGLCSIAPTSWDLDAELNALERRDRRKRGVGEKESLRIKGKDKESKKEKKERLRREEEKFDPDASPTAKEMFEASLFEVIDGDGKSHMFGDLIKGQRTIVVFIRHWYCPLCSDYVYSIVQDVQPEALERAGAKLIIIGNGSPKVVHSYQNKIFNCPFPIYTDPTLELYRALGMTRQTGDGGAEEEKGDYVKHGTLSGTLMVARNVGKMGITLQPGHFTQLGGEFVLGPGLATHYTHRMHTTRGHAPIKVALAHAGVVGNRRPRPPSDKPVKQASNSIYTGGDSELDRLGWKVSRDSELERMRTWREERRRGRLFNPEGETIRETIHEGESGSEDGAHRSVSGRRRSSAALTADGVRRGSAETAPYSLRHHHSAAPLTVAEHDDDVVDISRRPSTPDETNTSSTSQGSHGLASGAIAGFPSPPEHSPFSPIPETFSVGAHPYTGPQLYHRSPSSFARTRESTAESDLLPVVDLNDNVSYPNVAHLSPDIDYEHQARYRSTSGGTMGRPNPTFLQHHTRADSGETIHSNAVGGAESETSSFSRRDSRDAEKDGEEEDNGSEDSSYDALEPAEQKMGMGGEEFGYIVPDPVNAQTA